jgi:hypothetical protein
VLRIWCFSLLSNSKGLEKIYANTLVWITSFIFCSNNGKERKKDRIYIHVYKCRNMKLQNADGVEKGINLFSAYTKMSKY